MEELEAEPARINHLGPEMIALLIDQTRLRVPRTGARFGMSAAFWSGDLTLNFLLHGHTFEAHREFGQSFYNVVVSLLA